MRRLLLVGWEATDWPLLHPLLDAGEMPGLNRIVEGGVSGPLLSVQPMAGASLWTSLMTGKRAWQHGILTNHHPGAVAGPRPVDANERRCATLWEMLHQVGKKSLIVGWPATHGDRASNSAIVSDRYPEPTAPPGHRPWPPASAGTYGPGTAQADLDRLRVSPEDITSDLVARYVPHWDRIDQKRDRKLGLLRVLLAADFSCHHAMLKLLGQESWDFAAVRYPALGEISRWFRAFAPPKQSWATDQEVELYSQVLPAACRMLDLQLRQLIEMAGPDASVMVVSCHGGIGLHRPPSKTSTHQDAWKSPHGIFAASGAGVGQDELVYGAGILDVAPTILNWFGLPIGDDMEGRVLMEAFVPALPARRQPSWDASEDRAVAQDKTPANHDALIDKESAWNLACSYLDASRHDKALPLLQRLFQGFPERAEFGHALFQSQWVLKRVAEAEETLEVLADFTPAGTVLLLRAELAWAKRDGQTARTLVTEILKQLPAHPGARLRLGLLLLKLRHWNALENLARHILGSDENDALAWYGLGEALLRQGQPAAAEDAALRAIRLRYFLPEAHFVLARALLAEGQWGQACSTLTTLLQIAPQYRGASAYSRFATARSDSLRVSRTDTVPC